jgi:hypothetical protein
LEDAEALTACPVCNNPFAVTMTREERAKHLDEHFGGKNSNEGSSVTTATNNSNAGEGDQNAEEVKECPMCNKKFPPGMSTELRTKHLETHFDS